MLYYLCDNLLNDCQIDDCLQKISIVEHFSKSKLNISFELAIKKCLISAKNNSKILGEAWTLKVVFKHSYSMLCMRLLLQPFCCLQNVFLEGLIIRKKVIFILCALK